MLTKTFEWIRVANPQPSNEVVNARKAAVAKLLAQLIADSNSDSVADLCVAAIGGIANRFTSESAIVTTLVEQIRSDQPAFPANVSENGLELQLVAALTLGELFTQPAKNNSVELRDLAASLVIAQAELELSSENQHLSKVIDELTGLARQALESSAIAARQRREIDLSELEEFEGPADVPAFWAALEPHLTRILTDIQSASMKDREELELLWWMFSGYSQKLQAPLSNVSVERAAIACGIEVADRVLLPPHSAMTAMVVAAAGRERKPNQLKEQTLIASVTAWDQDIYQIITPATDEQQAFVQRHPRCFPLTWIAQRLRDGQRAVQWEGEFRAKTGFDPMKTMPKTNLALQVFCERIALRLVTRHQAEAEE